MWRSVTDIINCCPQKRFPIFSLFFILHFNTFAFRWKTGWLGMKPEYPWSQVQVVWNSAPWRSSQRRIRFCLECLGRAKNETRAEHQRESWGKKERKLSLLSPALFSLTPFFPRSFATQPTHVPAYSVSVLLFACIAGYPLSFTEVYLW